MLAPLPSLEAYRRDAVSIEDGAGLDDAVTAAWLESTTRLERAAMTQGTERERLLSGFLAQHGVVTFPASQISATALVAADRSTANAPLADRESTIASSLSAGSWRMSHWAISWAASSRVLLACRYCIRGEESTTRAAATGASWSPMAGEWPDIARAPANKAPATTTPAANDAKR